MSRVLKPGDLMLGQGPILICEFNPKASTHFSGRVCMTCREPILTHWLIPFIDVEKRGSYWCNPDGNQMSEGLSES